MASKEEEKRNIQHMIDGYPPVEIKGGRVVEPKGVTILSKHGVEKNKPERGVEIHDPRHG